MISNFQIKAKATAPWLEVQITKDGRLDSSSPTQCCGGDQASSNVIDLTDLNVSFHMESCGRVPSPVKLMGACQITDAKNGIITYKWHENDTYFPGLYSAYFEITFADNSKLKWPYRQGFIVEVL